MSACFACAEEVPAGAERCPQCGEPQWREAPLPRWVDDALVVPLVGGKGEVPGTGCVLCGAAPAGPREIHLRRVPGWAWSAFAGGLVVGLLVMFVAARRTAEVRLPVCERCGSAWRRALIAWSVVFWVLTTAFPVACVLLDVSLERLLLLLLLGAALCGVSFHLADRRWAVRLVRRELHGAAALAFPDAAITRRVVTTAPE